MPDSTSCCHATGGYCQRCDLLVGLPGLHVTGGASVGNHGVRGDRGSASGLQP